MLVDFSTRLHQHEYICNSRDGDKRMSPWGDFLPGTLLKSFVLVPNSFEQNVGSICLGKRPNLGSSFVPEERMSEYTEVSVLLYSF